MEAVNWPGVIEKNRDALLRIVAMLVALAGLDDTDAVTTLPRSTRNYLLRILRPAESAVRRLIILAAHGITLPPLSPLAGEMSRRDRGGSSARKSKHAPLSPRAASLPLVDPLKRFDLTPRRRYATTQPRVRSLSGTSLPVYMRVPEPPPKPLPTPDDPVDATPLLRRLHTLKRALEDLDAQARRLARWQARLKRHLALPHDQRGRRRLAVMRPGWPPGRRKRRIHEIDDILADLHGLAVQARDLDSS